MGIENAALSKIFEEFGEITSSYVQKNGSTDAFSNCGFVCFKETSSASEAMKKLNKQK
jgi:RNA recognition motif-containing protein